MNIFAQTMTISSKFRGNKTKMFHISLERFLAKFCVVSTIEVAAVLEVYVGGGIESGIESG